MEPASHRRKELESCKHVTLTTTAFLGVCEGLMAGQQLSGKTSRMRICARYPTGLRQLFV
jgi:hypothetical protein